MALYLYGWIQSITNKPKLWVFGYNASRSFQYKLIEVNLMTITTNTLTKLQLYFEAQVTAIKSSENYQKLLAMPPLKRWATVAGLFLLSQLVVFGRLYLIFGPNVVIGFFASILAGLATGLGALPALFFKDISKNLCNSMLAAAAGVMLAATAFSLLVPGITFGNLIWPGKGIYVVSMGMLVGAFFLH